MGHPLTGASARGVAALEQVARDRLAALDAADLLREERVWAANAPALACTNRYLGGESPDAFGAGASRLITGTRPVHRAFEEDVATWLGTPDALLFNSGYNANVGVVSALAERGDAVFSDALNHASLIDGVRLSRAERHVYPHADVAALDRALRGCSATGLKLVLTESVFSMDGDVAPLVELLDVCEAHDAALLVDEAHAIGVLGDAGRGACDAAGIADRVAVRVGTCGKAIGGFGAFAACSSAVRRLLYHRARSFVFTTALPPSVVAANREGLRRVEAGDEQARLWSNIGYLAERLAAHGWWAGAPQSAIFPVLVGENAATVELAKALESRGFYVHAIRPPTVPAGTSRLRLTVTSDYDRSFIDGLVDALCAAANVLGVRPPHG